MDRMNKFMLRTFAPNGVHTCYDGEEYPINDEDFCDRCGEEVKERDRRYGSEN
jgi:rRNA maturation endonuclease Nob1